MSTPPDRASLLRETLLFDWKQWDPPTAWRGMPAIALCLAAGIAARHPAGGLIAAAGAFTAGLGSLQQIRGSAVLPMLLAAAGTTLSTFVGMVIGHRSFLFILMAAIWAGAYALLTAVKGGTSWVGLQSTIYLLVASAFHSTPRGSLTRCSLVLAGGLLQTLIVGAFLRWRRGPGLVRQPVKGPGLRVGLGGVKSCVWMRTPVCVYSLRLALVITAAAEFYRHTSYASGYWVPMTTLLVVRADASQTITRGVMRVGGTALGAGLAGLLAAHLHPSPPVLAALIVFFAWWAYAVLNVNYALFTLNLTAYIVFLLSLSGLPPAMVVHRRALCSLLGGGFALLAWLDVFRKTRLWIRAERLASTKRKAA